jgi:hypothetical protein
MDSEVQCKQMLSLRAERLLRSMDGRLVRNAGRAVDFMPAQRELCEHGYIDGERVTPAGHNYLLSVDLARGILNAR